LLQHVLKLSGKLDDVDGRPGPKHHAIPLVLEARLDGRNLKPQEVLIDDELLKVGGDELFLLLCVTLDAMCGVQRLDLSLVTHDKCQSLGTWIRAMGGIHFIFTGLSLHAPMKAAYGFSPGFKTIPERSSSLFRASSGIG
jgi:hypothetical protein